MNIYFPFTSENQKCNPAFHFSFLFRSEKWKMKIPFFLLKVKNERWNMNIHSPFFICREKWRMKNWLWEITFSITSTRCCCCCYFYDILALPWDPCVMSLLATSKSTLMLSYILFRNDKYVSTDINGMYMDLAFTQQAVSAKMQKWMTFQGVVFAVSVTCVRVVNCSTASILTQYHSHWLPVNTV